MELGGRRRGITGKSAGLQIHQMARSLAGNSERQCLSNWLRVDSLCGRRTRHQATPRTRRRVDSAGSGGYLMKNFTPRIGFKIVPSGSGAGWQRRKSIISLSLMPSLESGLLNPGVSSIIEPVEVLTKKKYFIGPKPSGVMFGSSRVS